jgi:hypothetical protein
MPVAPGGVRPVFPGAVDRAGDGESGLPACLGLRRRPRSGLTKLPTKRQKLLRDPSRSWLVCHRPGQFRREPIDGLDRTEVELHHIELSPHETSRPASMSWA